MLTRTSEGAADLVHHGIAVGIDVTNPGAVAAGDRGEVATTDTAEVLSATEMAAAAIAEAAFENAALEGRSGRRSESACRQRGGDERGLDHGGTHCLSPE